MEKNQFRLADVILSVICVVFVAEAALDTFLDARLGGC